MRKLATAVRTTRTLPWKIGADALANSKRLDDCIDQQERKQADGQCKEERHRSLARATQGRIAHQADRDGQDADERAENGLRPEAAGRGNGRRHGDGDFVVESRTGVGDEGHMVGFAQNPREGEADPGRVATGDRALRLLIEFPVGGIHLNLGDHHRVRSAGADKQSQAVVIEDRALDRQVLDRRCAVVEALQRVCLEQPDDGHRENRDGQQQPEIARQTGGRSRQLLIFSWIMTASPQRRTCPSSQVR